MRRHNNLSSLYLSAIDKEKLAPKCSTKANLHINRTGRHPLHTLQQTVGNRAVQNLLIENIIEPKLKLSQSHGKYEKEAPFEPKFGTNFSEVRIKKDLKSSQTASALNAKAFTMRNTIVCGKENYPSKTFGLKKFQFHELAHTVQQDHFNNHLKIWRWKDDLADFGFNPETDLEFILGPAPDQSSLNPDPETMQELFLYLKRFRKKLQRSAPDVRTRMISILEGYFPGYGKQVWEDSRKPFAGYVGTKYYSRKRMKRAKELGLDMSRKKRWKKKFIGSDVVFFSGHHYAGIGDPGAFDSLDVSKFSFQASRVKLVMISSCRGLAANALSLWKRRFPNAYILGWIGSSPFHQSNMMTAFLDKLPEDLILDDEGIQSDIIPKWRDFVENLENEGVLLTSKTGERRFPWGVGYATPKGKVTYFTCRKGRNWKWVTM